MQRNIQQITQRFVDRLPENDQYYRPDDLRSWEFPSFIVRRIKVELERNLEESMIIPKTDWANTQSDAVREAWQKFVDTIREEARLPASYGKTVIETAVADVMEMLVQPRKNIPKVIFGSEDELSYAQVHDRMKAVVVYRHFPRIISRYMQKKELKKLSKERCRKIISGADQKLTSGYSPLNWAQMIEPIFKLLDGEIDTNLLRLFYEDKNMPRVARKFDLMDDMLTRAELIEVLSSPELLNFEGYEDDQSSLFGDQAESRSKQQKSVSKQEQPDDRDESEAGAAKTEEEDEDESPADKADDTLNSGFTQDEKQASESEDIEDDQNSLNAAFRQQDEKEKTAEAEKQAEPSSNEAADEDEGQETSSAEQQDPEETVQADKPESDSSPPENGQEGLSDAEDTPIWMRYMSDEEIDEYKKQYEQETQDDEVEEGFIDDPIIDLTDDDNEDATDEEIEMLKDQLSDDRELFVEEIFSGSDRAFDQAVEDIAAYSSWRDVSKYIEKEIFKRNMVDMYSEAAVDFTDRLQSYFLEKQNQNK